MTTLAALLLGTVVATCLLVAYAITLATVRRQNAHAMATALTALRETIREIVPWQGHGQRNPAPPAPKLGEDATPGRDRSASAETTRATPHTPVP